MTPNEAAFPSKEKRGQWVRKVEEVLGSWRMSCSTLHSPRPSASDTCRDSPMSGFGYPWIPPPALLSTTVSPNTKAISTLPGSAQYPDPPCK